MNKYFVIVMLVLGIALPLSAQNNMVIFGERDKVLSYRSRTTRPHSTQAFYAFHVPLPRNRAVAEVQIVFPVEMLSIFQPDNLEVQDRRTGRVIEVSEKVLNEETGSVRLVMKQPIAAQAGQELEIISSGGTNPSGGMYRVSVSVLGTDANPLFLAVGKWLVTIY